jgi:sterol desaturase/sphingolipid hydroxylase (fatty acid hydroxylase superfamily)
MSETFADGWRAFHAAIMTLGGAGGIWIIAGYYFAMAGGERLWYALRRPGLYDGKDGLNNIALNLMNSVIDIGVGKIVPFVVYIWVYDNFRIADVGAGALGLLAAFIVHDLSYYWEHRLSHRIGVLWAFHQVHHSSNEFNYTVAARGCWLDGLLRTPFDLPAALLGVPPVAFFGVSIAKDMFGIFNHSRFVPKLGVLEDFIATPANHRVHHGTAPKYIDKNYSQVLIIWDRIFGTFQREEETPRFGLVKPLHEYNPLKTQVSGIAWLIERVRSADRLSDKLAYLIKPPEWSHDGRCAECPKYRAVMMPAE